MLLQAPFHMVNFSIINTIARDSEHFLHQAMSDSSFLWCSSLAATDPYVIFPVALGGLLFNNLRMMMAHQEGFPDPPEWTRTAIKVMPIVAAIVSSTFCSGFNVYMIIVLLNQNLLAYATRNAKVMKYYECDPKAV